MKGDVRAFATIGLVSAIVVAAGIYAKVRSAYIPDPNQKRTNEQVVVHTRLESDQVTFWNDSFPKMVGQPFVEVNFRHFADDKPRPPSDPPFCGNWYSSIDNTCSLSPEFLDELQRKDPKLGVLAENLIAAHLIGHHIEHLLFPELEKLGPSNLKAEYEADYIAGVWAHKSNSISDPTEIRKAYILIDNVARHRQKALAGKPQLDTFVNGDLNQRIKWATAGFHDGNIREKGPKFAESL